MALSLGVRGPATSRRRIKDVRGSREVRRVQGNKIFFLNSMNPNNVIDMIKEGVMVAPRASAPRRSGGSLRSERAL